ncbi:hypothetical protein SAMN06264364_12425 [Quadrisphaera granulorum]|uniref:NYN domain-containing protein n=1 Tax=Quadrisphaera granulorum TaxID=317664 RepID=A0A315ZX31_9ACTN|nr:hypothetical protein [Quadrisphaera granulorum]PWJ49859.1 hypothetical protein BXY45_12425 [Quadrisphaera granulorum]SZE98067.1 hypothetical protein SAMN06264364_12425 [Quadrisphaera granulorum]
MGLGGGPSEADDYEWIDLAVLRARWPRRTTPVTPGPAPAAKPAPDPLADALCALLTDRPLWLSLPIRRVLLVDLDNLRAGPARWRARMAAVVTLARQADTAHLAGQAGAVERARPHLAEFAEQAIPVADGSDVADYVLLEAAAADARAALEAGEDGPQVLVVSNDGIFATLAETGPLLVLSPGVDALSDRLDDAATDILDLSGIEADVASELPA